MSELEEAWPAGLPGDDVKAIEAATRSYGVPSRSLAMCARWWQLETWLRQLAYVELRARDGQSWVDNIDKTTLSRQARDDERAYMVSRDWKDPLASLDASKLLDLIDRNWDLFGPSLIEQGAWQGVGES